MPSFRLPVASIFAWIAAVLVGVAPAILAADHGGILPRTQWAAAFVAFIAIVLAIPVTFARQRATGLRPHFVAILLIIAAGVGLWQMTSLPAKFVSAVSSGSASAYQEWLSPLSMAADDSQSTLAHFSISIAPWLTGGYTAMFIVAAAFAWVGSTVFTSRQRIALLLLLVLATGTVHSAFGFYQLFNDSSVNVWGVEGLEGGSPFGAYTNRNNSAVLINLGLGCGIGLLAWRLAALTGYQLAGTPIPANALIDLLTDRTAVLAMIGGVICGAGLIASGSRGGLAGGIGGTLLAFGLVSSIRRGRGLMSLTVGVALITAVLMVRFELPHKTLERLGATGEGLSKSVASDGRFDHWPDGARAAKAYFPAGAGAGTYRYAYLPYQQSSHRSWFVNADNLWLEWLVEMGLVGILLLALFLMATGRALIMINYSPEALDHGLASAGWFSLGSLAITQFFDFGLTLLPAAIMAALLFSAVITRSRSLRSDSPMLPQWLTIFLPMQRQPPDRNGWLYRLVNGRVPAAVALCGLAVAVLYAQSAFAVRTTSDSLQRSQRKLLVAENTTMEDWKKLIEAYHVHLSQSPHDAIGRIRLAEAELLYGRINAAASTSRSLETLTQRLHELSLRSLRSAWYRQLAEKTAGGTDRHHDEPPMSRPLDLSLAATKRQPAEPVSLEGDGEAMPDARNENDFGEPARDRTDIVQRLEQADASLPVPLLPFDSEIPITIDGIGTVPGSLGPTLYRVRSEAIESLRAYPLSDESRYLLARLDFAGGSPKQSRELLVQLASLRRQNSESLQQVGQAAATGQMWDLAASVWKRVLQVSPSQTSTILAEVYASPVLKPNDVIPHTVEALAAAAKFELRRANYDAELLDQAVKVLTEHTPPDRQTKSDHLGLLAQIELKRGNKEAAAKLYNQVVAFHPGDADIRYRYAFTLAAAGKIDAARQQARIGRQLALPEDHRFDKLIMELAAQSQR